MFDLHTLCQCLVNNIFHVPIFVDVNLLPCPIGFQLVRGKCWCHQVLLDNHINTCSFSNGTGFILRPAPYWIGLPNDTHSSDSILIHPHCPYDYCQSWDMNITAESPNTQCQYQRSGVLCGSSREGLSMILGSTECKTCLNLYIVSIIIFTSDSADWDKYSLSSDHSSPSLLHQDPENPHHSLLLHHTHWVTGLP